MISFADALPSLSDPTAPADPNELIWFYPGEWFGLDQPVPTIQLKWLRRAQQDYEYLYLARQRGQVTVMDRSGAGACWELSGPGGETQAAGAGKVAKIATSPTHPRWRPCS